MKIFICHTGYSSEAPKKAVLRAPEGLKDTEYKILSCDTEEILFKGKWIPSGNVDNWKEWYFYTADFSSLTVTGSCRIESSGVCSPSFPIVPSIFTNALHNDILCFFKSQRCTGPWERSDYSVPFVGKREDRVDVHGGWYDASGDLSKYLTHLSYSNFMNPQQTPMIVWHLLKTLENVEKRNHKSRYLRGRFLDEAFHGGDFLMRMQDEEGYFYMIVFDRWSKKTEQREVCSYETIKGHKYDSYQAGYRQGAGVAIAALARLARVGISGDYTPEEYIQKAEKGFHHLEKHNCDYLDNGEENIIDDYCALLAAVELYKATNNKTYLKAADSRAESLMGRLSVDDLAENWFRADNGTRPYFHAAEAGLPVIALTEYLSVTDNKKRVLEAVKKALKFELTITHEVNNPFEYARQYTQDIHGNKKTAFFIPHENETGYWWQGENARLASLAAAAYTGAELFKEDEEFSKKLHAYGNSQIHWILGLNPYDMCMFHRWGRNNPEYLDTWMNAPGGVCNGITSGFHDETDIDFNNKDAMNAENSWRWGEQWIPHTGWLLYASSIRD